MVIFHFAVGTCGSILKVLTSSSGPVGCPRMRLPFWGNAAASAGYPTMRFGQLPICKCVLGCLGYINDRGERTVTFVFFASRARKTCDRWPRKVYKDKPMPMKSSVIGGCYGGTLPINVHQVDLDSTYKFIDIDLPCLEKPTSHLFNPRCFWYQKWIPRYHMVSPCSVYLIPTVYNKCILLYINVQICTVSTNTHLSLTFITILPKFIQIILK